MIDNDDALNPTTMDDTEEINLLDMFGDTDTVIVDNPVVPSDPDPTPTPETNKAFKDLQDLFGVGGNDRNEGSGDVTLDLMKWFKGEDKLPSDPLIDFLSNAVVKAEFGMFFNMIQNFARIQKLQGFVDKAEDILFDPAEIVTLEPEELESRLAKASTRIKDLYEMNRRTITSLKAKKDEEGTDKLKIMLSAIPNHKLKDIISSLSKG